MNIKVWFENKKYYAHFRLIEWIKPIRKIFGWFNSLFINTNKDNGIIKVHRWQLNLCKCVTPDDFYIVTGIYRKLIKPKICEGYMNFGINNHTYKNIQDLLCKNRQWNRETMYGFNDDAIRFTWLNYSPMTLDGAEDWEVVWSVGRVREILKDVTLDDIRGVLNNGRP